MKTTNEIKLLIIMLIIVFYLPSVSAAAVPLPVAFLTNEASEPLRIVLSEPEVKKISQFDENRTEQLNRVIRHMAIELNIDKNCTRTGILIDSKEAFSYLQNNASERIYSFEPTLIYDGKKDIEDIDNDDFTAFLEQILFKANCYMDEFYDLFAASPDAFANRVKKDGTELRFSGFGKAVQRVTISFPADYVHENFPQVLSEISDSEECRRVINGLCFSGAQKISLLYDADGRIVRINYDGNVGQSSETLRKVSLIWKVLREKDHQKDSISLKTPAITGADKDNIALERDVDSTDVASGKYLWDVQIDHRAGKDDKKQTHFSAQLTDSDSVIKGTMEYSVKRNGENPKTKVSVEIREENAEDYTGTIEIADYSGKMEKNRFLIRAQIQKGESVNWPSSGLKNDEAPENSNSVQQNKPEDTIAAIVIQKLFELPEEDLTYFSNEIPAGMWHELIH